MTNSWPTHFRPDVVRPAFGGGILSSYCIALEAWRRGLAVTFIGPSMRRYRISDGTRTIEFSDSRPSSLTRPADFQKLQKKSKTIDVLRSNGIPTPESIAFDASSTSPAGLRRLAKRVGYPLVLKPDAGSMGQGVYTGLQTWEELEATYLHVRETRKSGAMILESHFTGNDHRILVIGGRVVAATRRVPTNVVGDGASTVRELIDAKNTLRKNNPFLSSGLIKVDYEVEGLLTQQQLDLDAVPAAAQHVLLRRMANGSAGGDVIDVTDELPQPVLDAAVEAVSVFDNIHIAGVDLLHRPAADGSAGDGDYVIIEMNSRPHIATNMYPTAGTGRDVPLSFVDYFFPDSRRPERSGNDSIVFDYSAMKTVLKNRVASEVIVRPMPGCELRRLARITVGPSFTTLSRVRRSRIARAADKLAIEGRVHQPAADAFEADVAGTSAEVLDEFFGVVRDAVDGEIESTDVPDSILTAGFRLTARTTARKVDPNTTAAASVD